MAEGNLHNASKFVDVISGQARADVSMLSFRGPNSFVVGNLQNHFPAWLASLASLEQAKIYDHLTPRLQHLLSEANKFKTAHQFQYSWAKNGQILLRKTHESRVIKLKSVKDLSRLTNSLEFE